jgi:hypothetical protein
MDMEVSAGAFSAIVAPASELTKIYSLAPLHYALDWRHSDLPETAFALRAETALPTRQHYRAAYANVWLDKAHSTRTLGHNRIRISAPIYIPI